MTYTFDENIFSDLYKDAHGFRPRGHEFYETTDARKQEIWDNTLDALDRAIQIEELEKAIALEEFENELEKVIALGAGDRETALRWMTQTEEFGHDQDVEHWVYKQGILFTDAGRALVKELLEIVEFKEFEYE